MQWTSWLIDWMMVDYVSNLLTVGQLTYFLFNWMDNQLSKWTGDCLILLYGLLWEVKCIFYFTRVPLSSSTNPMQVHTIFCMCFCQSIAASLPVLLHKYSAVCTFRCVSLLTSLCLSFCMEQLGSHWTNFHEIWYLKICQEHLSFIKL